MEEAAAVAVAVACALTFNVENAPGNSIEPRTTLNVFFRGSSCRFSHEERDRPSERRGGGGGWGAFVFVTLALCTHRH